jgi:predicted negative regulator of RcsB-dependent stress response
MSSLNPSRFARVLVGQSGRDEALRVLRANLDRAEDAITREYWTEALAAAEQMEESRADRD